MAESLLRRAGAALAAFVLLSAGMPAVSAGQTGAQIGPLPAAIDIGEGQVGSVTLVLENIQGAYGIDLQGRFDPAVLEIVPAEANAPLSAGGFILPDFVAVNRIDNAAGTFRWVATQVNPSPEANGSGPVVVIRVRGKVRGQSARIELTRVEIASRSGQLLPVTLRSGTVTVTGASLAPPPAVIPTAVPTSILTPAPGAPPPTAEPVQAPAATIGIQILAAPTVTALASPRPTAPLPPAATPVPDAPATLPVPTAAAPVSVTATPVARASPSPSLTTAPASGTALPASPSAASGQGVAPPARPASAALPAAVAPTGTPPAPASGPPGTVNDTAAAGALVVAAGVAAAAVGVAVWRRRRGAR